jgi:hypothetical protein
MFLLGGGLIGLFISAYKFVVNFRTTERGMARERIQQANKGERSAQYEAGLWQARAADLEYALRATSGPSGVPPMSDELRKFVEQSDNQQLPPVKWDADTGGRPGS